MNEIQNSLLETMELFSNNTFQSADNSPIITGEIIEIIDAALKKYKVKYLESEIIAIANSNINYSIGDVVYIIIPNGDFSKDKIIIGTLKPTTAAFVQSEGFENYFDISNNFIENNEEFKLNSFRSENKLALSINKEQNEAIKEYLSQNRLFAFGFDVKTELAKVGQKNGNYGMRVKIPVFAETEANGGRQSLIKIHELGIDQIIGSPYNLEDWSPQVLYFELDEQYTLDISKSIEVEYFCSDFVQDGSLGNDPNYFDIFFKNISLKIVQSFEDEDNVGYKLILTTSNGNYFFKNGSTKKTIIPKLKVNGEDTDFSKSSCYWFIEDSSVKPGHEAYLNYGGQGWRCLNNKIFTEEVDEEGNKIFNFASNKYTLDIDINSVPFETNFKCIVIHDNTIISNTIFIKNLNSKITVDLISNNKMNTFIKNTGNVELILRYYEEDYIKEENKLNINYVWDRYDKDGNYIEEITNEVYTNKIVKIDDKDYFETKISFPSYIVEQFNTIHCSIFKDVYENGKIKTNIITTKKILISILENNNLDFRLVINNDNKIYKYDPDGDSPMVDTYDGPVSSKVLVIEPLNFQIFKKDGKELTEEEYKQCRYTWYVPKQSMFRLSEDFITEEDEDYYIKSGIGKSDSSLPYKIATKFNKFESANSIRLEVDFLGNLLDNIINISFLKEGQSGTNGTKYAVVPVMHTYKGNFYPFGVKNSEGYAQKIHYIYYYNGEFNSDSNINIKDNWYWHDTETHDVAKVENNTNVPTLKVQVYEDGKILSEDSSNYIVKYSILDKISSGACFNIDNNGKLTLDLGTGGSPKKVKNTYCNVVQIKVTIKKKGNSSNIAGENTDIYAYYPIEITVMNSEPGDILPTLEGGFSEVLYASDGTNPKYDTTEPFICSEDIINNDIRKYYTYNWEVGSYLNKERKEENEDTSPEDGSIRLKPDQKYNAPDNRSYIQAIFNFDSKLETELNNLKDNNTTELTYINNNSSKFVKTYNDIKKIFELYGTTNNTTYDFRFEQQITNDFNTKYLLFLNETLKSLERLERSIFDFKSLSYYFKSSKIVEDIHENVNNFENIKRDIEEYFRKQDKQNTDSLQALYNYKIINLDEEIKKLDEFAQRNINNSIEVINEYLNTYKTLYNNLLNENEDKNNIHDIIRNKIMNNYIRLFDNLNKFYIYKPNNDSASINEVNPLNYIIEDHIHMLSEYIIQRDFINGLDKIKKILDSYLKRYKPDINFIDSEVNRLESEIKNANAILATAGKKLIHTRPIVLTFNRYELASLNAWDGNKLYIDEENGEYLYAPQIGAGVKDSENSFTGMIMGKRNINDPDNNNTHVGLFGYSKGIQSIFLNARNGSAIFGNADNTGGGQIIIDPSSDNKTMLFSRNYWINYKKDGLPSSYSTNNESGSGMLIDLSTPCIKWGNGNFYVNPDGSFGFGGDKIKYSATDDKIILDKVTIKWGNDNSNVPTLNQLNDVLTRFQSNETNISTNATNISINATNITTYEAVNSVFRNAVNNSLNYTVISDQYVISPRIGGGYLYITDGAYNGYSVEIDPKGGHTASGNVFRVCKGNDILMGIDSAGNAVFKGSVKSSSIEASTISGTTINNGNGTFYVDINGNLTASSGTFGGNITSSSTITGATITTDKLTIYDKLVMTFPNDGVVNKGKTVNIFKLNNYIEPAVVEMGTENMAYIDCLADFSCDKTFFVNDTAYFNNTIYLQREGDQCIKTYWKDGKGHAVLSVSSDGLTTGVGWEGKTVNNADGTKTEYNSILSLRSRIIETPNVSGIESTSDERLKNSLNKLDEFDKVYMNLKPISFKYNHGTSGRKHFGFGAAQVRDSFLNNGFTTKDFGGFIQMEKPESNEDYGGLTDPMGLIYTEFIAWNTHMIQKTVKELNETKKELAELKAKIKEIKGE